MDGFHLKKGEEKMFNKRLLKTFKAEMKNVYGGYAYDVNTEPFILQ